MANRFGCDLVHQTGPSAWPLSLPDHLFRAYPVQAERLACSGAEGSAAAGAATPGVLHGATTMGEVYDRLADRVEESLHRRRGSRWGWLQPLGGKARWLPAGLSAHLAACRLAFPAVPAP